MRKDTPAGLDTTQLKMIVERWENDFVATVAIADLLGRNPVAHKWKAPYRSLVIREALLRRMVDLGKQIVLLTDHDGVLGARIMLRCAIETTSLLVYLNQRTAAVIKGELSWSDFDGLTMQLLMGSRNGGTKFGAVNIVTMLDKANRDYGGLKEMHERMSESVHPNYDGVTYGYSRVKPSDFETQFGNYWVANFGVEQEPATAYVFEVFGDAYNEQWISTMECLETWLEANTTRLEMELGMS